MIHAQRSSALAALLVVPWALAACQAFEPTLKSRAVPPAQPRDATRSVLDLPPATPSVPEPDFAPPAAPRAAHLPPGETVRLEFRGKALAEAIHLICEQAGVNVYLDATLDARVDATFTSTTLDAALQTLLARHSLVLVEDPPGVYWVKPDEAAQPVERRFRLRAARAAEVEPKLKALLPASATVVVDGEQDFVYVRAPKAEIETAARFLEAADRNKNQVLIEMRIVEVTLGERFEFGLENGFTGIDVGDDALSILTRFAGPSDDFSVNFTSANGVVDSTLQALGKYVGVELLSSPRVVAVDNTQASIDITREVPYIQSTVNVTSGTTAGVGSSSTQEVAFKPVGIKLQVTPSIRADGVIEFAVTQELSEVAEFLNGVPAVDKRVLTSRFQVRDGDTLVVGGLMQDKKSQTDRGVPLLMDLPVLGALFRGKEDTVDKREMLVFLSPRIVSLDSASGVTDAWRQRLGERRAEMGLAPR